MFRRALILLVLVAGCSSKSPPVGDQPAKGPHGGLLVEWSDELRAEVTIDHDSQRAVVYVLDAAGNHKPLAVGQLWLVLERPVSQVELAAWPTEGDSSGECSRFAGSMPVPTRGRKFAGRVNVVLNGQTLSGMFDQQRDYKMRTRP